MWFMGFSDGNCKDCYACARMCPVHAIKVKDKEAHIMKERCIVCGKCINVCPQYSKVKSYIPVVKEYIGDNKTIVASVAPSYVAAFGEKSNKLVTALKKLGFNYVEETTSGIEPITEIYNIYANDPSDTPYITSFCQSVTSLIQKHHPQLIPNLVPVISSATSHSRILKEKYGQDTKVIHIGPCLSKKVEGYYEKSLDVVLTFVELVEWLQNEKIKLDELEETPFDNEICSTQSLLNITGEPLEIIKSRNPKRKIIEVDGIKDCIKVIQSIKRGRFKNTLIEMSCCRHGCLQGLGMPKSDLTGYELKGKFIKHSKIPLICGEKENASNSKYLEIPVDKSFEPLNVPLKQPTEKELKKILNDMGRHIREDEINCASCGYHTCREKAIAVYNGMAEIEMCLPFIREKAETLTNVIFDTVPEMIIIVNKEFYITQLNNRAKNFFGINENISNGISISKYLDEEVFKKVKGTKENIIKQKIFIPEYESTIIQSVIWVELNQVILFFAHDITEYENIQKKNQQVKYDAINMAQQVINKQMVVAQEIASLLGETTGETKATLTKLKNLIQEEEGK